MRTRYAIASLATTLVHIEAFTTDGNAFGWRMPCAAFPDIARIDPIVAPNNPSAHAHMFFGNSRFHSGLTYEDLRAADCTSCRVKEDKSAYWAPPLYFKHGDGKLETVPLPGGILVYYNRLADEYEPFPAGFRMIAGDPFRNTSNVPIDDPWDTSSWTESDSSENMARERAIGFLCLNYHAKHNEMAFSRHGMPTREFLANNCPDGLRVELAFPSCWNGKDLDSPNHRDHVAYDKAVHKGAPCPASHPVRLPSLIFEIFYDVARLAKNPGEFIFAYGDTTGFGYHADFMNGWDPAFLKQALEQCKNNHGDIENLPCNNILTLQDKTQCKAERYKPLEALSREVCSGVIDTLCGSSEWNKNGHHHGTPDLEPAPVVEAPAPVASQSPPPSMITVYVTVTPSLPEATGIITSTTEIPRESPSEVPDGQEDITLVRQPQYATVMMTEIVYVMATATVTVATP